MARPIDQIKEMLAQPDANAAPCARCAELENHIGNLLARIHRDGGHYQAEHGNEKAVADADIAVANAYVQITEQAARISELEARETILVRSNSSLNIQRSENNSLKEVISLSEDSRLMDEYLKLERANARQAERIKEQAAEIERLKKSCDSVGDANERLGSRVIAAERTATQQAISDYLDAAIAKERT